MPADDERDPLDRWLNQQVRPLPPPAGTFELITRRARRRKIRRVAVSVASAAAVAVVAGVAVPAGMSLHLTTPTQSGSLEAGSRASASRGSQSSLAASGRPASTSPAPSASATASAGITTPGYLPADFSPSSVTWDSTSNGWVIGPAGTPGHCGAQQDSDICTSVARTDDGGLTWSGLPAPAAGSPDGPSGVSGIRFLDGVNGWAFGPELWATHDAGKTWTSLGTGGQRVTDLETAGDRAYALFASCGTSGSSSHGFAYPCTSYTLMTTTAGSDQWTEVGPATTGLTDNGASTSAMIAIAGTTGYLVAPDGTLYSGPLGGTWQKAGTVPCAPGLPGADGLPATMALALVGPTRLAVACEGETASAAPGIVTSDDSGATWTTAATWSYGTFGYPASLAATSAGTFVLATTKGIWLLNGTTWTASSVTGADAPQGGFSYVGMTSAEQGVALPADTSLHAVYMTTDGGQTWQVRPIKSLS
ncbi:MAG TPA: hypothetical protein VGM12_06825 [Trebonia sp.]|jgi:hypothetical protein